jgi:uncharacterized protein (DUF779 family)
MEIEQSIYDALVIGPAYTFTDGLHDDIPIAKPGVYTIWRGTEFVYVGVAGRGLDFSVEHTKIKGLRDRLDSHWRGRRSGGQFAV